MGDSVFRILGTLYELAKGFQGAADVPIRKHLRPLVEIRAAVLWECRLAQPGTDRKPHPPSVSSMPNGLKIPEVCEPREDVMKL